MDFNFPSLNTVPYVTRDATLEDVHSKMIQYKMGVCFIVDIDMTLLAVFTDGDFRRVFFGSNNLSYVLFTLNALDSATHTPISFDISESLPISDLVALFNQYNIYDVPVTNNGRLVSSVNIHAFKMSLHD